MRLRSSRPSSGLQRATLASLLVSRTGPTDPVADGQADPVVQVLGGATRRRAAVRSGTAKRILLNLGASHASSMAADLATVALSSQGLLGEMVDYGALPRIHREALRMLWIHDYWDGPLSGMLVYQGKLRWFECCDLDPETRDVGARRFVVRDLADEELAEEGRWHALFVEHVGDHWTVHADGHRGTVRPPEEHAKFYEPYSKRSAPDYSVRPILGWFEL